MAEKGGRIPPDGRPPQAAGIGKDAKRHDLERPATPGLAGSDLQYGDVRAMEQGQRIAPAQVQERVPLVRRPVPQGAGQAAPGVVVPDAIDFLAGKNGPDFNVPVARRYIDESKANTWLPILRQLVTGPGASPALVNAFINQARAMSQAAGRPATIVDLHAADEGIEAMLSAGIKQ